MLRKVEKLLTENTFIFKMSTITRLRDRVNKKDWIPLLGDEWSRIHAASIKKCSSTYIHTYIKLYFITNFRVAKNRLVSPRKK